MADGAPIGLVGEFDLANFDQGMAKYNKAIADANANTTQTAGNFGKSFNEMGGSVNKVAGIMGGVLVGGTLAAGAALGGFAVKGIEQAKDMEKQMSTIASIMGKTTEQVKPLADEIVKLGLDPSLMVDSQQAADAIQQLAKNGLSMDQILQGAAKSTVLLANATGADFGQAADIATGAMKMFNIDAKDMQGAVSGIVSVTTNSKLNINDYANALANGGGAAVSAGVSFKDFNTSLAATSTLFSGGADAATSFKSFITRLQPATKDATDTMIKLGLATANGKSKFFDANGQIKSMAEISGLLQKALTGLSDAQKSQALNTLFGADAMRTAVGLANTGKKGFEDLQAQMGKTDAAEQAATKMNNLAGVIEITKGAIDAVALTIGQAFLPMVTDMAKSISQFISDHSQGLIDFFQTIADVITQFVSGTPTDFPWEDIFPPWLANMAYGFSSIFEGVLKVISDMRSGVFGFDYDWSKVFPPWLATTAKLISTSIQFVSDHIDAFKGAMMGVAAVLAASSISAMLAGIAAAIAAVNLPLIALIGAAALVGAAWNDNWFGIRDATMPILAGLQTAITDIGIVVKSFSEDVPGAYPWEEIFPPWLADTLHYISYAIQGVQTVMDDLQSGVFGYGYDWENVFPTGLAETLNTIQDAIEAVTNAFSPLTTAITENGPAALKEIEAFATGNQTSFDNVKAIWDGLSQSATNVFNGLSPIVSAALTGFTSAIAPYADAAVSWIATAIQNAPPKLLEWYTALTTAISSHVGEWVSYLIDWSDPLVNWIDTATNNIATKVQAWFTALTGSVGNDLTSWQTTFDGWSDAAIAWMANAINGVAAAWAPYFTNLLAAVAAGLPGFLAAFYDYEAAALSWISTATAGLALALGSFVSRLIAWGAGDGLQGITSAIAGWGTKFLSWVDDDVIPKAGPAMGRVLAELVLGIGKIVVGVGAAAVKIGEALYNALTETDWTQVGTDIINLVIRGIEVTGHLIKSIADGFTKEMSDQLGIKFDWNSLGNAIMTKVNAGVSSMMSTLSRTFSDTATNAQAAFTEIDWESIGTDIIHFISDAVVAALTYLTTGIDFVVSSAQSSWTSIDWGKIGTDLINAIRDKAVEAANDLYTKFTTIIDTVKTKFTDYDWKAAGQAIIDGIKKGIDDNLQTLWDKVQGIVDSIKAKIKNALGMGSPAKELIPHGEAIVDGLILGMKRQEAALYSTATTIINHLSAMIASATSKPTFLSSGFGSNWFTNPSAEGIKTLEDYVSTFSDLVGLASDYVDLHPELATPVFGTDLANLSASNKELQDRQKLLEMIQKYNLNPSQILGGKTVDMMTPKEIATALYAGTRKIQQLSQERLTTEAQEIQRLYDLSQVGTLFGDQVQKLLDLSQKPMNFFQQIRFGQLSDQFNALTKQMDSVREQYIKTGASELKTTLSQLTDQREAMLWRIKNFQSSITLDQAKNDQMLSIYNQQLTMLDQLDKLGWDLPSFYYSYFHNADQLAGDALARMGSLQDALSQASVTALQKQIAEKALLSSLDTDWNVSGIASSFAKAYSDKVLTPIIKHLHDIVLLEDERNRTLQQYNQAVEIVRRAQEGSQQLDFLNSQIDLLQKVKDSGLDIKTVFAGVLSGKNVLGPGANINDLLSIANQLQQDLINKAQAQLSPQAIALAAQQQEVEKQKQQLDLLNRQLDIIHQGQQAGVNWEGFFAGLTTGLDATESDILTATSRLYHKLIKQALKELGIASPSKVMIRIGKYMTQGLGVGLEQGFNDLRNSMTSIPIGPVTSRMINMSMGGVTINNGLDEVLLESRIQRILERSLA